ncbi:hypothetical protein SmJEL517_g04646 [Synchytrium microbalum]|uniref:Superoxide dismutase n=1 Tax=Synchytrium microbalum TaxID=1806994 RepID=A0A507C3R3_9FUNG|nr:uncharacterized protein SmJEL517_g04646 [Synchytrium microbalum]TPX32205.1 hypothetical protein SmJEL517_g04646 [Synchytrium microbalum]
MALQLPKLRYEYAAYEPAIDEGTMTLHHTKHFQAYIDNYNAAAANVEKSPLQLLRHIASEENQTSVVIDTTIDAKTKAVIRNHGGGYVNHAIYFDSLCPPSLAQGKPAGDSKLLADIAAQFKSWDEFKAAFTALAMSVFGSGWAFMVRSPATGKLKLVKTANQDIPEFNDSDKERQLDVILALDVWEHAYYIKYNNRRRDYIDAWWTAVDWNVAESYYIQSSRQNTHL